MSRDDVARARPREVRSQAVELTDFLLDALSTLRAPTTALTAPARVLTKFTHRLDVGVRCPEVGPSASIRSVEYRPALLEFGREQLQEGVRVRRRELLVKYALRAWASGGH